MFLKSQKKQIFKGHEAPKSSFFGCEMSFRAAFLTDLKDGLAGGERRYSARKLPNHKIDG